MKIFLENNGCKVCHDLNEPDIDIILMTEPRADLWSSAYSEIDILYYVTHKNPRALVVHRINECDERKSTKGVNQGRIRASKIADHVIFISNYLIYQIEKEYHLNTSIPENLDGILILGGATNPIIFKEFNQISVNSTPYSIDAFVSAKNVTIGRFSPAP